ncbi:hypothetical protein KUTeg_024194 [Tegillarca granosa]|uniref:Novel STAND NTPase 3 domain-containing protein n=1 Tax=Tegillarca granosa TaxID=220873 RepID=A0ABQ9DWN3_TEGGR|nr:hypothetical protein KUTeg_024194 [Tegillarca granosa]
MLFQFAKWSEMRKSEDLKQQIIEKWDTDEKSFCETKASKKVTNVVKNNTLTVITGPPGSGKSAIAHHIATTLQNQDYQIVPVTSVEDLEHSWVQGSKQVFVLDDVFGVHKLNESEIDNWYQRRERSKICFQNNKIILTMRNQYSHSTRLQALLSEYQYFLLDITRKDLLLSQKEKRSMFMKHMSGAPKRSNCNDTVKNCEFLFFPLLCRLFATDNESKYDLNLFFKNPLSVLKTEFELLRENKDGKYLGLVLCVIYDNKLAESHLDIGDESKETKHLRKDFAECCGLSRSISRQEIKQNLDSLLGTYVLKESGFYKFTHAIIYDVVLSTLTSEFQSSILKHCSLQFIIQRVILYSSESKDQGFVILNDNFKPNLVNRLISDITKGNVLDVLKNTCLKNEAIEELFLYQLKTKCTLGKEDFIKYTSRSEPQLNSDMEHLYFYDDVAVQRRKSKRFLFLKCTINFSPVHLIVANQMNKTFHYVYDLLSSSEQNSLLTDDTIMKVAALYGNQKVFELCLEKTRTLENFDLLYCSVTGGHVEIVRQILEKRPKVVMFLLPCLKRASRLGYNKIVKLLIRNGADPNTCDNDGLTALHFASQTGQNKTAQLLIKNGAIIDRPDNDGQTPLHTASFHGHYKTVQTLLTNGAVINICDKNDVTALHAASENGHDNTVQLLIKNGATVDKCNVYGITALFMASKNGHDSTVKILVDNGADVDIYDKNGITALHAASENGHDNTVQLLIKNGASVDKCNIYGITALQMASHNGHDTTVQTLINNDASINKCNNAALIAALLNGHDSTIKVLLDNGASANHVFNNAVSALHLASTQENVSTVQLLIDNGASVDKEFKDGSTALHFASEKGYDRIVQTLIDNDADINKCNNDGHTALHLASLKRYESTVKKLIDNGANVNKCENNGQTSLQIASYNGHDSIVQKLIDKGASVNKSDLKGYTALHTASQNGHNSTVQLLIDNGASVNKSNTNGCTALHLASGNGHNSTVQILIDNDASVNYGYKDGFTALHLASQYGHDSTVQILIDNGANVDEWGNVGFTALHLASKNGHDSTVKTLIDNGVKLPNLLVALTIALSNNYSKIADILFDHCYKRRLMLIAALLFQLYRKNMNEKEKLNKEILRVDYILSLKI